MLFSEMEVQKRAHEHDRPPILPPPGFESLPAKTTMPVQNTVQHVAPAAAIQPEVNP
jgi:hypothetical protein